jgi:hypothetical protein
VRRFGKENVVLLSHAMNPNYEEADIRRFGDEVASYLGMQITYANADGITEIEGIPSQFEIILRQNGIKQPNSGNAFCTYYLKTLPFQNYLKQHHPKQDGCIYYGFDENEIIRKNKRMATLGAMGWDSDYVLIDWKDRTIHSTLEIGIVPPNVYSTMKHANCTGCLKAGIQHWYVVYHTRQAIWNEAKEAEAKVGYSILKNQSTKPATSLYLSTLEPVFDRMKEGGVPVTEHFPEGKFRHYLKKYGIETWNLFKPCECVL